MKKKIRPKTFGPAQLELPKLTPEEEQQLDYDVCCCIEELENLLIKNPTERQKKLAEVSLKILKNPSESFIKKKQVMRQQFGDYRKKFENKKKDVLTNLNCNKASFKAQDSHANSIFVKKFKHKNITNDESKKITNNLKSVEHVKENNLVCSDNTFHFSASDNSFRFNF